MPLSAVAMPCKFMDEHVYPNEQRYYREAEELGPWSVYPVVE